jgi:hypothetical protein
VHRQRRLVVLVLVALHRADQGDVVHLIAQVREEIADHCPALATRLEIPPRLHQRLLFARQAAAGSGDLAIRLEQLRLMVERVHVRHAAG